MVMALIIWHHQRCGSERGRKREGRREWGRGRAWWRDDGDGDQGESPSSAAATSVSFNWPPTGGAVYISRCRGRRRGRSLSQHALRLRNIRYTARLPFSLFLFVLQWPFLFLFYLFPHISTVKVSDCVCSEFSGCLTQTTFRFCPKRL